MEVLLSLDQKSTATVKYESRFSQDSQGKSKWQNQDASVVSFILKELF